MPSCVVRGISSRTPWKSSDRRSWTEGADAEVQALRAEAGADHLGHQVGEHHGVQQARIVGRLAVVVVADGQRDVGREVPVLGDRGADDGVVEADQAASASLHVTSCSRA